MKRENSIKIDKLMELFVRQYGLEEGLSRIRVFVAWDESIGTRYSKVTSTKFFKGGILYCTITSSVARNHLFMNKSKIIADINQKLGKDIVRDIVLK